MWLNFYQNKLASAFEFFPGIFLKGPLDILIIAFLIYFVFFLIKKTRLLPIILGVLILFLIYEAGIILDLPLTKIIFKPFSSIFLIILVVIFQKELRRFFAIIGIPASRRKAILPVEEQTLGIIIQAIKHFIKYRIGALIVFPGQEPIERHLEGGAVLNGVVSLPLLLSIFDESSPGHDGAIIIEDNKIKKFAVHLPLAENIEAVKKFGTRHRAGLGLAEISDALTVVVSQEKGVVSIAYNKNLTSYNSVEEVERIIHQFLEKKFPRRKIEIYVRTLKGNFKLMLVSLVIAFFLWWLLFPQIAFVQKQFVIPVQFENLSQDYIVSKFSPAEVKITFSGRESDFELIDPQELRISLTISEPKIGWKILKIEENAIKHPPEISPVKIETEKIEVLISKKP